jgi:hypothetical protein
MRKWLIRIDKAEVGGFTYTKWKTRDLLQRKKLLDRKTIHEGWAMMDTLIPEFCYALCSRDSPRRLCDDNDPLTHV